MNLHLEIDIRQKWREWLQSNHSTAADCWIVVKRGKASDNTCIRYLDAVEEALCFGWIDSTQKTIEPGKTAQRFSPRSKKSNWTELNRARCRRLEQLGLMTDAGRAAIPKTEFEVMPEIIEALQAEEEMWQNYLAQPELYRRVRIDTIQFYYKRDKSAFNSRLQKYLEATRQGLLIGKWNDDGLLNRVGRETKVF